MWKLLNKVVALTLAFTLVFEQAGFAQMPLQTQIPAYIGGYVAADRFRPMQLRSLSFDSSKQDFHLFLDQGDEDKIDSGRISREAKQLMRYFRIGLALPNETFWVNLRPDGADQIIDPFLEKTDIGQIMLSTDLQLKKDLARFTSPKSEEGREYWGKLYSRAQSLFGTQEISIPTLTRPWIVPGEIFVRETGSACHILKASLKVLLEQDHIKNSQAYNFDDPRLKELNDYSSQLVRELILPKLTREVNSSKKYASLRQVYYSLILAQWFKEKHRGQQNEYARKINNFDLNGLASAKPWKKEKYFNAYRKSFKKGEYNISENRFTSQGATIRQYFSGGERIVFAPGIIKLIAPDSAELNLNGQLPAELTADLIQILADGQVVIPQTPDQNLPQKDGGTPPNFPGDDEKSPVAPIRSPDDSIRANMVPASTGAAKGLFKLIPEGVNLRKARIYGLGLTLALGAGATIAASFGMFSLFGVYPAIAVGVLGAVLLFKRSGSIANFLTDQVVFRLMYGETLNSYLDRAEKSWRKHIDIQAIPRKDNKDGGTAKRSIPGKIIRGIRNGLGLMLVSPIIGFFMDVNEITAEELVLDTFDVIKRHGYSPEKVMDFIEYIRRFDGLPDDAAIQKELAARSLVSPEALLAVRIALEKEMNNADVYRSDAAKVVTVGIAGTIAFWIFAPVLSWFTIPVVLWSTWMTVRFHNRFHKSWQTLTVIANMRQMTVSPQASDPADQNKDGGDPDQVQNKPENVILSPFIALWKRIYYPGQVRKYIKVLGNHNANRTERERAAEILGNLKDPSAIGPLTTYLVQVVLGDDYDMMSPAPVNSLKQLGKENKDIEIILLDAYENPANSPLIRLNALKLLSNQYGGSQSLERFISLGKDKGPLADTMNRAMNKAIPRIFKRAQQEDALGKTGTAETSQDGGKAEIADLEELINSKELMRQFVDEFVPELAAKYAPGGLIDEALQRVLREFKKLEIVDPKLISNPTDRHRAGQAIKFIEEVMKKDGGTYQQGVKTHIDTFIAIAGKNRAMIESDRNLAQTKPQVYESMLQENKNIDVSSLVEIARYLASEAQPKDHVQGKTSIIQELYPEIIIGQVIPYLKNKAKSETPYIQEVIAEALPEISEMAGEAKNIEAELKDGGVDDFHRSMDLVEGESVGIVIKRLKSESSSERERAARQLGGMNAKQAVEALKEALIAEKVRSVRNAIAYALASIDKNSLIDLLAGNTLSPYARNAAEMALSDLKRNQADGGSLSLAEGLREVGENARIKILLLSSGIELKELLVIMDNLDNIPLSGQREFRKAYFSAVRALISAGLRGADLQNALDAIKGSSDQKFTLARQAYLIDELTAFQLLMDFAGVSKSPAFGRNNQAGILIKLLSRGDREQLVSILNVLMLSLSEAWNNPQLISDILVELVWWDSAEKLPGEQDISRKMENIDQVVAFLSAASAGGLLKSTQSALIFSRMFRLPFGLAAVEKMIKVGKENKAELKETLDLISDVLNWGFDGDNLFGRQVIKNLGRKSQKDNFEFVSRLLEYQPLSAQSGRELSRYQELSALKDFLKPQEEAQKDGGEIMSEEEERRLVGFVEDLTADSAAVRAAACEGLKKMNKLTEQLKIIRYVADLSDPDSNVRLLAVEAFEEIGSPETLEPLVMALRDRDKYVRVAAVLALGKINNPKAVEPLLDVLADRDSDLRLAAAEAIGHIVDLLAIEHLEKIRADENNKLLAASSEEINSIVESKTVKYLLEMLADVDKEVRLEIIQALGSIADPLAVEPLIKALSDPDREVRLAAVAALGSIGDPSATGSLHLALANFEVKDRYPVVLALQAISHKNRDSAEKDGGNEILWFGVPLEVPQELIGQLNNALKEVLATDARLDIDNILETSARRFAKLERTDPAYIEVNQVALVDAIATDAVSRLVALKEKYGAEILKAELEQMLAKLFLEPEKTDIIRVALAQIDGKPYLLDGGDIQEGALVAREISNYAQALLAGELLKSLYIHSGRYEEDNFTKAEKDFFDQIKGTLMVADLRKRGKYIFYLTPINEDYPSLKKYNPILKVSSDKGESRSFSTNYQNGWRVYSVNPSAIMLDCPLGQFKISRRAQYKVRVEKWDGVISGQQSITPMAAAQVVAQDGGFMLSDYPSLRIDDILFRADELFKREKNPEDKEITKLAAAKIFEIGVEAYPVLKKRLADGSINERHKGIAREALNMLESTYQFGKDGGAKMPTDERFNAWDTVGKTKREDNDKYSAAARESSSSSSSEVNTGDNNAFDGGENQGKVPVGREISSYAQAQAAGEVLNVLYSQSRNYDPGKVADWEKDLLASLKENFIVANFLKSGRLFYYKIGPNQFKPILEVGRKMREQYFSADYDNGWQVYRVNKSAVLLVTPLGQFKITRIREPFTAKDRKKETKVVIEKWQGKLIPAEKPMISLRERKLSPGQVVAQSRDGGETQAPETPGGIDFRALPVVPSAVKPGANAAMPKVSLNELDGQWKEIQRTARNAELPYQQMKQFVSCCRVQEEAAGLKREVAAYVVNLLKLEEERAIATPEALKEIVALVAA